MLCRRFQIYKSLAGLLSHPTKRTYRPFSTAAIVDDESENFKAAVLHSDKRSLVIETVANRTKLEDGMVRIGIECCSVMPADVRCFNDLNNVALPYIPGSEFGGKVLEVGPNCVQKLKPGDNVAILSDEVHIGGGLSQQCIVDGSICIPLDDKISIQNAVTVLQSYGNAQLAFTKYCPLKENDNIIVIAGSGGNGLAAIEMANKHYKANVFVVFDSSSVNALIRDDSAYRACSAQTGLTKTYTFLDSALKHKKAKVVYDTTGSGLFHVVSDFVESNGYFLTDDVFFNAEKCERPYFKRVLSKNKKKQSNAKATPEVPRSPPSNAWIEKVQIVHLARSQNDPILFNTIVSKTFSLLAEKKIDPYVSAIYALADVNKAMQFIQRKKCLGKVLVDTTQLKTIRV